MYVPAHGGTRTRHCRLQQLSSCRAPPHALWLSDPGRVRAQRAVGGLLRQPGAGVSGGRGGHAGIAGAQGVPRRPGGYRGCSRGTAMPRWVLRVLKGYLDAQVGTALACTPIVPSPCASMAVASASASWSRLHGSPCPSGQAAPLVRRRQLGQPARRGGPTEQRKAALQKAGSRRLRTRRRREAAAARPAAPKPRHLAARLTMAAAVALERATAC